MASFYKFAMDKLSGIIGSHRLLKYGLNISPMYRRSTAKVTFMSKDMRLAKVKIPLNWKNKNYMNSLYGGSMFSAVDPIPMMQLIEILGKEYVVWDKGAAIRFKRPARENLHFEIKFEEEEIETIKQYVKEKKEMDYTKTIQLTDVKQEKVFCQIDKIIYIAEKSFYQDKKKAKNHQL